jgi:hypothetical protein
MARLFNKDSKEQLDFLNSWFYQRVIRKNQNVILTFTGSTGSGKTYCTLSAAESWYKKQFKEEFPINNVCFSLGNLAKRINQLKNINRIRKGEMFILEEAGANFGNLDFQNRLSKMFGYILQSFRSLNLIVLMTLPVLTMLNKGARQLIHGNFITAGIDYEKKIARVKPLFHQLNQQTGKSYWKYPRFRIRDKMRTLNRMEFLLPSESLITEYEKEKEEFVYTLTKSFESEAEDQIQETMMKKLRRPLSPIQKGVSDRIRKGYTPEQIAELNGCSMGYINRVLATIYEKGYDIKKIIEQNRKNPITVIPDVPQT